jgi:predicted nucleic acid-binding Zn ribbon protein
MTPDDPIENSEEFIDAVCRNIGSRQRYRRGPKRIQHVVNELIARRGYASFLAPSECLAAWDQAAGDRLAPHTRPGNVRRGVLQVFVRNSAVMQELTFRKRELIRRLRQRAPDQKIRDLRFRVGPVD